MEEIKRNIGKVPFSISDGDIAFLFLYPEALKERLKSPSPIMPSFIRRCLETI